MQPIVPTISRTGDPVVDRNLDEIWKTFRRLSQVVSDAVDAADDHKVMVDSAQTPVYLESAVAAGSGVTITKSGTSPGKVLTFSIAAGIYDLSFFIPGTLTSGATLAMFEFVRSVTLPASFTGSYGDVLVAPTAAATITIKKNGSTTVGTVNVAGGATAATFTVAAQVDLVAGDTLSFVNQAIADATMADLSITVKGVQA